MQLQVVGMLDGLSLSFPSRVKGAIGFAKIANLDLVRHAPHWRVISFLAICDT
jgi:hypothetical protein